MNKILFPLLDGFFLLRPVVLIPVWGFSLFGYFKGTKGTIAGLPVVWRATDPMVLVWIMIFSLSVGCVYVLNQIADIEVDKKNSGLPLLANGIVSRHAAYFISSLAALAAIGVPFFGGHPTIALFSIASIGTGALYSFRPCYFSGRPFSDFLTNAVGFGIIAFGAGWHLAGRKLADPAFLSAATPYFLLMCAGAISSTIPDIKGDSEGGKCTTAVILGEKNAHYLATVFLCAAVLYSLVTGDRIASVCAVAAFPLYLLHAIHPRRIFAESTYKIGGVFCMAAASCIAPPFVLYGATVAAVTWMYFRFRHGVSYPSLIPRGKPIV
ncbi:MAG: prenyltransferase [Chitinispirillaceae bacterium]|jgi:4-hydroxybenzoate polyprenyltransferase